MQNAMRTYANPVLAMYILYSEVTVLVLTSSLQPYTYGSSCTQLPNIPIERQTPINLIPSTLRHDYPGHTSLTQSFSSSFVNNPRELSPTLD
jgi:hypothetical protein